MNPQIRLFTLAF